MDASPLSRADGGPHRPVATVDRALVLARAGEFEAQGRFLEAAHALAQLPRDERDPEVDVRMVQLRHLAYRPLRPAPAPTHLWPLPAGDDPFGGTDAPEVPFVQVTPELLATAIHHHGCLIVRDVLSEPVVSRLRDDIDQAFQGIDAARAKVPSADTIPWYIPLELDRGYDLDPMATAFLRSAGGVYAGSSPRAFLDYVEALGQAGVTDLVGRYFGEMPVLSLNKTVLRRIGGGAEPTWHQDASYLGVGIRAVDLWVSLSDCGGDTDVMGLDILPRPMNDLAEMGTHDAVHPRAVSQYIVDELSAQAGVPVQRPHFHPGDGILFDPVFLHRSDPRPLPAIRYAIESWWFAPSTFPDNQVPLLAT